MAGSPFDQPARRRAMPGRKCRTLTGHSTMENLQHDLAPLCAAPFFDDASPGWGMKW
jgi:hypothetical protein